MVLAKILAPQSVVLITGPSHMSTLVPWSRMAVPLWHGCLSHPLYSRQKKWRTVPIS